MIDKKIKEFIEENEDSPYIKVGGIVILSLAGVYMLGHTFKILAHFVNGFNAFKASIKNGKQ